MVALLRGSALLALLPEAELQGLADRVHRSRHGSGAFIFRKGDEGAGMMIVLKGRVKIGSVGVSGSELILNVMEPGQIFGEMALVDGEPRSADAVAAKDCEIVTLLRRDFLPVLSRHPDAALGMMAVLSRRIRQTTQFVEDAIFLDVAARLLHRIEQLAERYGCEDPESGAVRIDHDFTQQDLADSVGLTRVSINRQLSAWEERGLIEKGRGWIRIPDPDALDAFVRG
jgi:CRP-like cAMP-binding protein